MSWNITRVYRAAHKYLFRDTRYFFLYLLRSLSDGHRNGCAFYGNDAFVKLIESGKSFIRLGDGEIGLLHYLPIHYQKWSPAIRDDFLSIIGDYSDSSPYILMIPLFVNATNAELGRISKLQVWMPLKVTYEMIFPKDATYFDQHIFYRDGMFEKLLLPYLAKKKIIVVTNAKNIADLRASPFHARVFAYIPSPDADAYEAREDIRNAIEQMVRKNGLPKNAFVVLLAAGLAKTIVYTMSKEGYQLFDVGKGLEGFYKGMSLEHQI